jgi:hypothetical protein
MAEIRAEKSVQREPRKRLVGEDGLVPVRCEQCRFPLGRIEAGSCVEFTCDQCGTVTTVQIADSDAGRDDAR